MQGNAAIHIITLLINMEGLLDPNQNTDFFKIWQYSNL